MVTCDNFIKDVLLWTDNWFNKVFVTICVSRKCYLLKPYNVVSKEVGKYIDDRIVPIKKFNLTQKHSWKI